MHTTMAAIMTTPDRHAPDVSQLLRRPTTRPTLSIPNHTMERPVPVATRHASAPTPLRRPHSGVPAPQPIPLSIGPVKRTAGELRRIRQTIPSRHPPRDPTESTCLTPISGTSKHEASPSVPSIRRAQLSLQDLNAPKAKRRSVEFSQPCPLPKFVLSPADSKPIKSRSAIAPRLLAPVFTGLNPPELRRSSTHPTEMRAEWADGVSRNSDGMTRLSLCEGSKDNGARLFGNTDTSSLGPAHHMRNRSGDTTKRLSLPKALEDVFDSSSPPHAAITPSPHQASRRPLSHPGVAIVPNGSPFHHSDGHITIEDWKPRSGSLPEFVLPTDCGIEKKKSNIEDGRTLTLPRSVSSKVSRLPDSIASGWPGVPIMTASGDSDEEDFDMDSFLFATMHAKQAGRASMPSQFSKPNMPDTPVKHTGRASMPIQRPWQTVAKPTVTHERCE